MIGSAPRSSEIDASWVKPPGHVARRQVMRFQWVRLFTIKANMIPQPNMAVVVPNIVKNIFAKIDNVPGVA